MHCKNAKQLANFCKNLFLEGSGCPNKATDDPLGIEKCQRYDTKSSGGFYDTVRFCIFTDLQVILSFSKTLLAKFYKSPKLFSIDPVSLFDYHMSVVFFLRNFLTLKNVDVNIHFQIKDIMAHSNFR